MARTKIAVTFKVQPAPPPTLPKKKRPASDVEEAAGVVVKEKTQKTKGPGTISPLNVGVKEQGTDYFTNTMQCGELGGNYYVVHLKYIKLPIIEFNNGILPGNYTWILLEIDEGKRPKLRKLLLSSKVQSGYEIGTKHSDIIHNFVNDYYIEKGKPIPPINLLYAGEMDIKEPSADTRNPKRDIWFNFESGTYMLRLGRQKTDIDATYAKATTDILQFIDKTHFNLIPPNPALIKADNDAKQSGIQIDKDKRREDNSFITHKKIKLTYETLRNYLEHGATIYRFKDETNCKTFTERGNRIPFDKLGGEHVDISSLYSGGKRKSTRRKRKSTRRKRKSTRRKRKSTKKQ